MNLFNIIGLLFDHRRFRQQPVIVRKTKPELLKRYRRQKRVALVVLAVLALVTIAFGGWVGFGWLLPLLALVWVAHEAWFSDHLFYRPDADYRYCFDEAAEALPIAFSGDRLTLCENAGLAPDDTLILAVNVRARGLGRLFDPAVRIETERESPIDARRDARRIAASEGLLVDFEMPPPDGTDDCQTFERGACGVRYLNLTGFADALQTNGVRLTGRHCRLEGSFRLWRMRHPDYRQKRLLVIAPHADDAELAAFGLYRQARESWIVTLTAGEIETEHYQSMGMDAVAAARLKGRLRAWDSIAVPQWAGIPPERAIQLGYFCLRLAIMRLAPDRAFTSREAGLRDTRYFRVFNRVRLASDADGHPSWNTLIADLREIFLMAKPEVIVLPHPSFDPHPDHLAAHDAVQEALRGLDWQPETLLGYANHLHDNDRWPMGEAQSGVALPPLLEDAAPLAPWSLPLDAACQTDKAMALAMMHDLTTPLPFKKRLRRALQRLLAQRRHPPYGNNEFFRKAVRRHELFWVIPQRHDPIDPA